MASDSLEYGKLATTVAINTILGAREDVLSGKQLTPDDFEAVGKSIGWLALVTAGQGEYDVFAKLNKLCKDVIRESNEGVDSQVSKLPVRPPSIMAGGAGKKDQPIEKEVKATGNPLLLQLIMGSIAIFFAGGVGYNYVDRENNLLAVTKAANEQKAAACPADVTTGSAPRFGKYSSRSQATAMAEYKSKVDTCDGIKKLMNAQIAIAEQQLIEAENLIPVAVGGIVSALSLAGMGPAAATPAGISASVGAGASAKQLIESMAINRGNVPSADIANLVNGMTQGFTSFSSSSVASPSTAPAAPGTPSTAPAPAFSLPETGGRRTRIKKRGVKKARKTRRGIRAPLFRY